eukprot:TRINITY_DN2013_c0_g4_i3.p1 TRINITY_DN2013_c0_g4~~TRINITY_DN2013_c0_g4_i3.p1  ORF type:complete len:1507 (-),score=272.92 TRINITY_DN2013_c0_g4_i3:302-4822(-)
MRAKVLTVAIFFGLIIVCCGLQVKSITYKQIQRRIGLNEEIDAYIFDLYFDSKIYLKNNSDTYSLSSFNFSFTPFVGDPFFFYTDDNTSLALCLGKSDAFCAVLSDGQLNLAGIFELECSNNIKIKSLPIATNIITYNAGFGGQLADYLIPLIPSSNPFEAFIKEYGWIDDDWTFQDNKLSFIVFNALTRSQNQFTTSYTFGQRPTISQISTCRFKVVGQSIKGFNIVGVEGSQPIGLSDSTPTPIQVNTECTPNTINLIYDKIQNFTDLLKKDTNWNLFLDTLWDAGFFLLSEKMRGCKEFLDSKLNIKSSVETYTSTYCYASPSTLEWEQDACCNPLLKEWSDKCCHGRNVTNEFQQFTTTKSKITSKCSTPKKSEALLQDYISLRNLYLDPDSGCSVSAESWANYKRLIGQLQQLFICYNTQIKTPVQNIISIATGILTPKTCKSDKDCFCSKCDILEGVCGYCDTNQTQTSLQQCFQNNYTIPINIENLARAAWNLTNATESDFYSNFFERTKQNLCVSQDSIIYYDLDETECTKMGYCKDPSRNSLSYSHTLESSCSPQNFSGVCEICSDDGLCTKIPFGDTCVINEQRYNSKSACAAAGFTWNVFESFCYTGLSKVECQCGTGSDYPACRRGYCQDTNTLNSSDCVTNIDGNDSSSKFWDSILGVCVYKFPFQNYCENNGGKWVGGKYWRPRNDSQFTINSQSDCENLEVCSVNNKIQIGNCSNVSNCIGRCPKCESSFISIRGVCFSNTINNRSNCLSNEGTWESNDNICLLSFYNQTSCVSNGHKWESCIGMDYSTCSNCHNGIGNCTLQAVNTLGCYWNGKSECDKSLNSSQCAKNEYCQGMESYPSCSYLTSSIDTFGCPICLYSLKIPFMNGYSNVAFTNTSYGNLTDVDPLSAEFSSSLDFYSIYGCLTKTVKKPQCLANGGRWVDPFFTKESCNSVYACTEPLSNNNCLYNYNFQLATIDGATNKTQKECVDCGGTYGQTYNWRVSEMIPATKFKTIWKTKVWEQINSFIPFMSPNNLTESLLKFLFVHPQLSILSAIQCEAAPIYAAAGIYYCDCNTKSKSGQCFPKIQSSLLGSQLFCRGENTTVRLGISKMIFTENSVSSSIYCTEVSLNSTGVTQFRNSDVVGSSALLGSLSHRDIPYAIVKNQKGFIVGQVLSDGLSMNFQQSSLVQFSKRDISTRSIEINNFTLCIDSRTDIHNDNKLFPLIDFASTKDFNTYEPLRLNITFENGAYCASLSTNTITVVVVSLKRNWETIDSIFDGNEAVRIVLFVMSGIMFVMFVGCVGALLYQFFHSKTFSIPKVALVFILIYSALRAVFFLLFGLGVIDRLSKSNNAGYFILAELPYYVFLSIFLLVVMFWIVISSVAKRDVLRSIFWPFLITNVLLYTFFIIVLIVSTTVTGNGAVILNKVYKSIVAFIALAIVVFAIIFGTIVLKNMVRGWRLSGKKLPRHLIKTSIILFITAIALLLQIAYLLYSAFAKGNISFAGKHFFQ